MQCPLKASALRKNIWDSAINRFDYKGISCCALSYWWGTAHPPPFDSESRGYFLDLRVTWLFSVPLRKFWPNNRPRPLPYQFTTH